MPDNPVKKSDMQLIMSKLQPVKDAGWGEILIQVSDGNIVYIKQSFGEQIKMDLNIKS